MKIAILDYFNSFTILRNKLFHLNYILLSHINFYLSNFKYLKIVYKMLFYNLKLKILLLKCSLT